MPAHIGARMPYGHKRSVVYLSQSSGVLAALLRVAKRGKEDVIRSRNIGQRIADNRKMTRYSFQDIRTIVEKTLEAEHRVVIFYIAQYLPAIAPRTDNQQIASCVHVRSPSILRP